jgi:hypothetical protein
MRLCVRALLLLLLGHCGAASAPEKEVGCHAGTGSSMPLLLSLARACRIVAPAAAYGLALIFALHNSTCTPPPQQRVAAAVCIPPPPSPPPPLGCCACASFTSMQAMHMYVWSAASMLCGPRCPCPRLWCFVQGSAGKCEHLLRGRQEWRASPGLGTAVSACVHALQPKPWCCCGVVAPLLSTALHLRSE